MNVPETTTSRDRFRFREYSRCSARSSTSWSQKADQKAVKTLYVCRPVLNAKDIIAWAKSVGFEKTVTPDDMHVTIAYSREPIEWPDPLQDQLMVSPVNPSVQMFGEKKDCAVLQFGSRELFYRWMQICKLGASWDWPDYAPHVTLSYDAAGMDLADIEPYDGLIVLGPEEFAEVNEDWKDTVVEKAWSDKAREASLAVRQSGSFAKPISHSEAHAVMVDAGYKRISNKGKTESHKMGRSAAHISVKVKTSNYVHSESGHVAEVRTKSRDYSDTPHMSYFSIKEPIQKFVSEGWGDNVVEKIGWTDEARAASLEVRRDKYGLDDDEQHKMWGWKSGIKYNALRKNPSFGKTLEKFPKQDGIVYRGMSLNKSAIANLKVGSIYRIDKFSSASTSKSFAKEFAENTSNKNAVLLEMDQKSSRRIPRMYENSGSTGEKEAVLMMGTKFKVTGVKVSNRKINDMGGFDTVTHVQMKQL